MDPRPDRQSGPRSRRPWPATSSVAANALYHLVFDDFCVDAEAIKPRLYARDPDAVATALFALDAC